MSHRVGYGSIPLCCDKPQHGQWACCRLRARGTGWAHIFSRFSIYFQKVPGERSKLKSLNCLSLFVRTAPALTMPAYHDQQRGILCTGHEKSCLTLKNNECIYCIRHSNISELNLQWKAFAAMTTVNRVAHSPHIPPPLNQSTFLQSKTVNYPWPHSWIETSFSLARKRDINRMCLLFPMSTLVKISSFKCGPSRPWKRT